LAKRLQNKTIGLMLAGGMLALLVTTMLIRKFGDYSMLTEPAAAKAEK
jgi:hypothetical protein